MRMSERLEDQLARALHEAEVRLWVEERELELLDEHASPAIRHDLEAEVARLRAVVDKKRADAASQIRANRPARGSRFRDSIAGMGFARTPSAGSSA